jgi:hypothetical protein
MGSSIAKWGFALMGGIAAVLLNTAIFLVVCTIAICMDCYTAWSLSKRVKTRYPKSNDGKFKSKYANKIFGTMVKIYSLILLAYLLDHYVLIMFNGLFLSNFVTGIFCAIQIWSMLENESSCNGSRWAKVMQKIMVDKASRHFDIDLSELENQTTDKDEKN